ncbi:hypothetical protein LWC34_15505 [Kibdelosporangium philippinense]|uniref:Amylo-alpha-1,6-glucosidase n=1 Tax=Kibdelosporangium philippinense TaxID=211113 RepID=A0ABS8Z8N4_9PSEU|nr:glycogen debranching N-terminal domain-containing protein [Kibdelosporangium philippinense]MCE7004231.1 hypothetical protein [Kibdelosporangium philippinense]
MTGPSTSLHSLVTVLKAPSLVLSDKDGQLSGSGPSGWFIRDKRALARVQLTIANTDVVTVGRHQESPWTASFHSVARDSGAQWRDSTLHVRRSRVLEASNLMEGFEVTNFDARNRTLTVTLYVATDFAGVDAVKAGRVTELIAPDVTGEGLRWQESVTLRASPAGEVAIRGGVAEMTWQVSLNAGETWRLALHAEASPDPADFASNPGISPKWTKTANDVADANLEDLRALVLADGDDIYAAAGSPWYLTLFGRDSIWAARLMLPLGTELAAGTVRALARRQGTRHDPDSEEQPGKIPHELRPGPIDTGQVQLASRYYGTIDATPLWICLLHEAGLAAQFGPQLAAAMEWLTGPDADPDGDGLIEYLPSASGGLTHHGWKDSHDAFLHQDGRQPTGPIALSEVHGYAYAAAALTGSPQWMDWAERLKERFRATFWVQDASGRYPAIALDGDKKPIIGATSNMGHLLGTGLLDAEEVELVAARLSRPDMLTPYGLRTATADSPTFNPFSYHRGSVWPHDTAIAMVGLAAEGKHELATLLAEGILRGSEHFGGHTPELYAVLDDQPLAYPNACVPQAWSAAAVVRAGLYLASP